MTMTMDRRKMLALGFAGGAAALAGPALAKASRGEALWRRSLVIDGNLAPPIDPEKPLTAEEGAAVLASGLTALKASIGGPNGSHAETLEHLDAYDRALALNPTLFTQVRTLADFDRARREKRVGIIYSFESVEMLEGRIDRIDEFARRGVRAMQLNYNGPSAFASGVMSPQPSAGLTPLGREAVARMNAAGVSIDISHSDDRSSADIMAASTKPVSITHAGCAAIHTHPRNKSDAVLKAVADQGGVVGLYNLSYLTPPPRQPDIAVYMAHLEHALKVCGEDHVGLGSDALMLTFETTPEYMAAWDASIAARKAAGVAAPEEGRPPYVEGMNIPDRARVVAEELLKRGYRERTVEKVLGLNFRRWFRETWTA